LAHGLPGLTASKALLSRGILPPQRCQKRKISSKFETLFEVKSKIYEVKSLAEPGFL
jgi:hypothetical protein